MIFFTGFFGSFAVVAVRTFEITEIIWLSVMDMYCSQDLPGTTLAVCLKIIVYLKKYINQSD